MTNLDLLKRHVDGLKRRSLASAALFVCFFGLCLWGGFTGPSEGSRGLFDWIGRQHPATLLSFLLLLLGLATLPRDYKPTAVMNAARDEEELMVVSRIDGIQRWGIALRLVYILGSVLVLFVIPRGTD